MKTTITTELVRQMQRTPPTTTIDIYDVTQPRLVLRVQPNGGCSYRVRLARGKWFTLGGPDVFTAPSKARKKAQSVLGDVADGTDPQAAKRKARLATLSVYLEQTYRPWLVANRKTGAKIADALATAFAPLANVKLDDLTAWRIESWRRTRLKSVTAKTTNLDLAYLKAMLTRACAWGHLASHALAKVKTLSVDDIGRLRFLSPDEETRLRTALTSRDDKRRAERDSANEWRREREYDEWPAYGTYTDHLTPMVLFALNTGLRFGEITGLKWRDVDLVRALVTVVTHHAKSGKARHVPLNSDAVTVLRAWRPASPSLDAYVFPGPEGDRLVDVKTAWTSLLTAATIKEFRFHDLRHTFASKLVQSGVDLNTVRELLGHADIAMTLRYAHLAPEHRAAAVAKLVSA